MANEVKVPDIGDFKNIPVIEIHVKPGQTIAAEEPLITLESDKATMDVPAPAGGVVKEVKVKLGDKVSEGSLVLVLEGEGAAAARPSAPQANLPPPAAPRPRPHPPRMWPRAICTPRCWCSAPGRAVTPPPSARPISARRSCWSNAGPRSAASA
ncbi:MAG: hypothetical protein IPL88_14290 [Rhizobiales bacterium]|nr:hypothetical protein [Hyphomicrobiales bacterium]